MRVRFPPVALAFYMEDDMKDILDKIKKILDEKIQPALKGADKKMIPFLKANKRYFAVAALFVCLIYVLVFYTGAEFNEQRIAKLNHKEVTGEQYEPEAEFEIDAYPEVNDLVKKYFAAYVNADFVTLETVATPISDMEKSYITTMSQFYEEYRNIVCYTKHGLSKDSYIVSACFDIKFAGHDLTAPSMVLFYIQTAEDGSLFINNLYSDFNMYYSEEAISKDVYTALIKYTTQEDYLELYSNVESAFNNLIKENTDVYQLTKRTIPGVRQQWEDSVYYVEQSAESTEIVTPPETEGTSESEPTPEDTPEPEPEIRVEKVKCLKNDVNVRKEASPSGSRLGKANQGNEYVKLGVEDDENGAEWTKIQFTDDEVGYIKSSFLETVSE